MESVFLDHQSTTPPAAEVIEAMRPFFCENFGNPSSLHRHGLRARDALARARDQVAALIHAETPDDIIFTSGATESANLAVKGVAYASRRHGRHLVLSQIEHPSLIDSVEFLEKEGFTCTKIEVNHEGLIDPEAVRVAVRPDTTLICVHHVNHDIGTVEPIRQIANLAAEHGIPLFVDAAASGGWLPIDVQALGATLLSLAPHRFYGPKGVGVLYRNRRARLTSLLHGGVQEAGRRAGTENVPAIVGAGVAAEIAASELPERIALTGKLQQRLWAGLKKEVPHTKLNGPGLGSKRITTNLNISVEFVEGEGLALLCDMQGIAVASGASCMSKALKVSHVLSSIGLHPTLAQANVIMSLGRDNTQQEVDYVLEKFPQIVGKLRGMSPMWDEFQNGRIDSVIS